MSVNHESERYPSGAGAGTGKASKAALWPLGSAHIPQEKA